ncbi:MAG: universal stress protein [Bacteroidota bacterium]
MKHIIVPVDFSEEAIGSLEFSLKMARRLESHVIMVYVLEDKNALGAKSFEEGTAIAEQKFAELHKKFRSSIAPGVELTFKVRRGNIVDEVSKESNHEHASLIMCSSVRLSGFNALYKTNTAYKIIANTKPPVLSFKNDHIPETIKKILVPLDTTPETRQKATTAAEFAKAFHASVEILAMNTSGGKEAQRVLDNYTDQVELYFKDRKIPFHSECVTGSKVIKNMMDHAEKVNADVICIMTEQEVKTSNFLLGSFALQIVNESPVPVLSVRPRDTKVQSYR